MFSLPGFASCQRRRVAIFMAITPQLAADGARTSPQCAGNCPHTANLRPHHHDPCTFPIAQLPKPCSHRNLLYSLQYRCCVSNLSQPSFLSTRLNDSTLEARLHKAEFDPGHPLKDDYS